MSIEEACFLVLQSVLHTKSCQMYMLDMGEEILIEEIAKKILDPLLAPLMASDEDLEGLPPTYIFNAEFDVLRDDGLILAARLERVGVEVTRSYLTTEEHGFLNFVSLDPGVKEEIKRFTVFFNETLNIK